MKHTICLFILTIALFLASCGKKDVTPEPEKSPPATKEVKAVTAKTWKEFVMAIKEFMLEIKVIAYTQPTNAGERNISAIHTYINAVKELQFEGCDEELATFLSTYPRKMEGVVRDGLFSESRGDSAKQQAAVREFNSINRRIRELAQALSTRYGEPFEDPWVKQ